MRPTPSPWTSPPRESPPPTRTRCTTSCRARAALQVARHATHLSVLYVVVRCEARPAGPGGFELGALGELPVGGLGLRPPSCFSG